jgi:hypothetical protein
MGSDVLLEGIALGSVQVIALGLVAALLRLGRRAAAADRRPASARGRRRDELADAAPRPSEEPRSAPPAPADSPLAAFARTRGWRVLSPWAVVGDVRGVRIGVERELGGVRVDVDTRHASPEALAALPAELGARLPGTRIEQLGAVARIEWAEPEFDAERLDATVEVVADACSVHGGAYR